MMHYSNDNVVYDIIHFTTVTYTTTVTESSIITLHYNVQLYSIIHYNTVSMGAGLFIVEDVVTIVINTG